MGLLAIKWVDFRPFDAFLVMEVIHSPGAAPFDQQGRSGAVDNFPSFYFLCQNLLGFRPGNA